MISWIFGIVAITAPTPLPAAKAIVDKVMRQLFLTFAARNSAHHSQRKELPCLFWRDD